MIVIIGATGTVGRATIGRLTAAGHKVAAVTRTPSAARFPADVEVVHADASAPDSLAGVWDGAEALLLSPRAAGRGAPR